MKNFSLFLLLLFLSSFAGTGCTERDNEAQEHPFIVTRNPFKSVYLENTALDICFPSNYSEWKKYAVLYVHEPEKDANDLTLFDSEWVCSKALSVMDDSLGQEDCVVVWIRTFYPEQGRDDFRERFVSLLNREVSPFVEGEYNIREGRRYHFFASADRELSESVFRESASQIGGAAFCEFSGAEGAHSRLSFRFVTYPGVTP